MKLIRHAVAYVIYRPGDMTRNSFLIVKRPDDDPDLPGVWGLPAVSVRDDESFELAIRRAGRQKLGVILDFDDYRREDGFVGRDVIEMEIFFCIWRYMRRELYEASHLFHSFIMMLHNMLVGGGEEQKIFMRLQKKDHCAARFILSMRMILIKSQ